MNSLDHLWGYQARRDGALGTCHLSIPDAHQPESRYLLGLDRSG